jgi:hypothetical protein
MFVAANLCIDQLATQLSHKYKLFSAGSKVLQK